MARRISESLELERVGDLPSPIQLSTSVRWFAKSVRIKTGAGVSFPSSRDRKLAPVSTRRDVRASSERPILAERARADLTT